MLIQHVRRHVVIFVRVFFCNLKGTRFILYKNQLYKSKIHEILLEISRFKMFA